MKKSGLWNILAEVQEARKNPGFSCLLTTLQIIWMELEIVPSDWHGTTKILTGFGELLCLDLS